MREPDKTRYMRAVKLVEQEDTPFFETEVDFTIVEEILKRKVPRGLRSYELPASDYVEFLERTGMDMAYVGVLWKLGRREGSDAEDRRHYIDGTMKTRADLERIVDPGQDQIKQRLEEMIETVEGTGIGIVYALYNTPFIVTTAVGYEAYYLGLRTEPDFLREFFKRVDDIVVKQVETALEYPIDAVLLSNILAVNTGPIMPRDIMEEFEFPYLERHIDMAHDRGLAVVYHCDGNNMELYPKLIDMGIDVFQAIEPCGGAQDIYEMKRRWGDRVALHGNIDVRLLMAGDPEQIASDVVEHIERLSPGGGYICGSSHDINEKVPVGNFLAMIEAVHGTKAVVSQKKDER